MAPAGGPAPAPQVVPRAWGFPPFAVRRGTDEGHPRARFKNETRKEKFASGTIVPAWRGGGARRRVAVGGLVPFPPPRRCPLFGRTDGRDAGGMAPGARRRDEPGGEIREAEIRRGLREGGRIRRVAVVARPGEDGRVEHAVYVLPSWFRSYRLLRTARGEADRTFRSVDKLLNLARALGYAGEVTIHPRGAPGLRLLRGVRAADGGTPERPARRAETAWRPFAPDPPSGGGGPAGGDGDGR